MNTVGIGVNRAGPIGIMAVAIARYAGARHVVITDVNDYRLSLAGRWVPQSL
jgi:threonine 3-dehydrogenase